MDDETEQKYELDKITIDFAENGFSMRCNKKLTAEARAEQQKSERNNNKKTAHLEYYKSEEYVAESKTDLLKLLSKEIDEYRNKDTDSDSDDKNGMVDGENVRAGGIGFR